MKQILPLTKIGFFNPGRLSDEEIEQIFIARVKFFEFVFKKIVAEEPNSIPQHHLIIGQRGMGKSSLLTRIAAELRKPPYRDAFIPLSFPEEQYNIDRLSKFWLNCLDALADALDKEQEKNTLTALDAEIRELSMKKDLDATTVYATFEKWISHIGRRPVLLVDNLNLIFSKLTTEEQHVLRAILMHSGAPVLVGASATVMDETTDYHAPFYDAFQINYLRKLSFKESIDLLVNLARITGNTNIDQTIYVQKARLEALYQLTGGTPRTLAILFPLIQGGFSEDIQTDLDALLDVITPLYKARFEELPPQLQVILDAIALHWDPISPEQLKEISQLEDTQLLPQLKKLVDVGWLQKLNTYKAKKGAYELSERFFNVWYLMRRSSRRQKREIYCLTKFLESFYGKDLPAIAKSRINHTSETTHQITLDLALADAVQEKELGEKLRDKSYNTLLSLSMSDEKILQSFTIPAHITQKRVRDLISEVEIQVQENKYQEAEIILHRAIKIDENDASPWHNLGNLYQYNLGQYQEAEAAYKKAIELDEKDASPWNNLGNLYMEKLSRYQEAEAAYRKAIELDEKGASPWNNLGNLYQDTLGRYQEAEAAYRKAIELDEKYASPWYNLGNIYKVKLGRYQEAEAAYRKAIELDEKDAYPWHNLGNLYQDTLGRYQEAEAAYRKAIELDEKDASPWHNLGNLYMEKLSRYLEAEAAYRKAIELDEKYASPWHNLGNLYMEKLSRYQEAEAAYRKAIKLDEKFASPWNNLGNLYMEKLSRYQEAEAAYKKAIELDEKDASPWYNLGILYKVKLARYQEAEAAYRKAIELDEKDAYPWLNLGNLYMEKLSRYQEAEAAYRKAIELDEKLAYPWNNLGNLYQDTMGRYQEAEAAYRKAIELDEKFAYPWNGLGNLYQDTMGRYQEAEAAYRKAIELDEKYASPWYRLGNLYYNFLHDYEKAESAYRKALEINPSLYYTKYNLIALLRDKMNRLQESKQLFATVQQTDELKDRYFLHEALFTYYEKNIDLADASLKNALLSSGDSLPPDTVNDWYRSLAVIIKLGFASNLLHVFAENGYDIIFKPLYIAIGALNADSGELFLNSVAQEVREPAKKLMEMIKNYT